jgi:glycosyltransferase involved in cell wall biosynthesis
MTSILDSAQSDVAVLHTRMSEDAAATIMERMPTAFFAHEYSTLCPAGGLYFRHPSRVCDVAHTPNHRCLINAYVHGCNTRRPNRLASTYAAAGSFKHWLLRVQLILCASSFVAERHAVAGYSRARLIINPYPVVAPPTTLPLPGRPHATVLYAGRLVESKGVQTLIEALPMIGSSTRLVISGGGPYLSKLQRLVAKLGATDRVTFRSPSYGDDLAELYRASSVVVVPSLWPEPFGLVGPEAMAHGRPVVASEIGGIPEWLAAGTGILVPPGNPIQLASAINYVLSERGVAAAMGARARKHVMEHFSMDGHLTRLLSALQSLKEQHC